MTTIEEEYARDLYRALEAHFIQDESATVSISWRQMTWKCEVQRGSHRCLISCAQTDGAPRYYIDFLREPKQRASGSTPSQPDVLKSVEEWLNDVPLALLYDHYAFVDAIKRKNAGRVWHYKEEDYARNLHSDLVARLAGENVGVNVQGRGVHWSCKAQRDLIHCTVRFTNYRGVAGYELSFENAGNWLAQGKTPSTQEAIEAVEEWLRAASLPAMYERFAFVDEEKRSLERLHQEMSAHSSKLAFLSDLAPRYANHQGFGLRYNFGNRSCQAFFDRKDNRYCAVFYWGKTELFQCEADSVEQVAAAMERWVCDHVMPSEVRKEFPWIEIGELADYYEMGKSWEGECLQSWNRIEEWCQSFYSKSPRSNELNESDAAYERQMSDLVAQMRAKGFDRTLRAGQSMLTLVLSRSLRHGLRADQPRLDFRFHGAGTELRVFVNGNPPLVFPTRNLTPELELVLRQLEDQEID